MNRIQRLFRDKKTGSGLLSIYYTAGFPKIDDTLAIAHALEKAGVDFLEIGFPYSDPVADGPVIQYSSEQALKNGMSLKILFGQLKDLRRHLSIPVILMGYINPMLQFGVENFCESCKEVGVDGIIIPDLPLNEYEANYKQIFDEAGISVIFLITPQTADARIKEIDRLSSAFIYMVSSYATTGKHLTINEATTSYFKRVKSLNLVNPIVVGFGISDNVSFNHALKHADGAIIGSAFVKMITDSSDFVADIPNFIFQIKGTSEAVKLI